eukprot:13318426-Ditylum_brightwellii.AAC.1
MSATLVFLPLIGFKYFNIKKVEWLAFFPSQDFVPWKISQGLTDEHGSSCLSGISGKDNM